MKEKIKKISKYAVNGLNMFNFLLLGLAEVWNWQVDKVSATIIVAMTTWVRLLRRKVRC